MSNADAPNARLRTVLAASTSEYPKVCIDPGLILSRPDLQQPGTHKPILTYIFLVQGKNASERTKIVAKPTRDAAAAAMLHEIMNGYSIVFSGAFLSSNVWKLLPATPTTGRWKFSKVKDVAGLNSVALEKDHRGQATTVGIWC